MQIISRIVHCLALYLNVYLFDQVFRLMDNLANNRIVKQWNVHY